VNPSRQCAGGTRLAAVGGSFPCDREGSDLSEEHTGAADGAAIVPPEGAEGTAGMPAPAPVPDEAARLQGASVCPFLRSELDGVLGPAMLVPDDANRCVAKGQSRQQSARQQELVCLRAAHADCPRYPRGAVVAAAQPTTRRTPGVPRATLVALVILALSAAISFGFVLQRGGIDLPVVAGSPASTAAAAIRAASPTPTGAPVAASTAGATPAPSPAPTPAPAPTAAPTAAPTSSPASTPTVAPTPAPTRTPAATPSSDRYRLLKPCPGRAGCWIYTVHAGDNLFSIAHYFGHPISTIYAWNPRYPAARLRAGDQVRMPPPTR